MSASLARPRRRKNQHTLRMYLFFVMPALVVYTLFQVVPLFGAFGLSLTSWSGLGPIKFIGFRNYWSAFHDPTFWQAAEHTLIYASGTTVVKLGFALGLALLANKQIRLLTAYRTVLFFPALMSFVAVGILWGWLYNPEIGIVNPILHSLGINTTNLTWFGSGTQALPALMFVEVWKWTGWHMVIFLAGLQLIPNDVLEAAQIDGAGRISKFWNVTLPLLRPVMVINFILAFVGSLNVFDLVYVTTGGGPFDSTQTIMTYVYKTAFQNYSFGYAATLAVLLFIVSALVTIACLQFLRSSPLRGGR